MNELLKVSYDDERITLSARELYEFLEIKTQFKDWFPRMCEYGFMESIDFNPLKFEQVRLEGNREVKREIQDYQITIDMAKEIAMLQRNEKGKQARQYFIELEKIWNSPEKVMARALEIAHKTIDQLKVENHSMKPKALFADAVATSDDSILVGQLAKLIKQNGKDIGQNRLFEWLRQNGYLCSKGSNFNLPTQKSMDLKLMEIKERTVTNSDGSVRITKTPKITGKGQIYFINKLKGGE